MNSKSLLPSVCIPLLLCLGFATTATAQFNYSVKSDTAVTITGYTGPAGPIVIPDTINVSGSMLPVTGIADYAFSSTPITSATIPAGVTSIGAAPFAYCTSLTSITVASLNPAYTSVGGVLFDKNQTLLIQYPAGNTGTSYTIPSSVSRIGTDAFMEASKLSVVSIPAGLNTIDADAFEWCTSLSGVTIPNSVTHIGVYAFYSCAMTGISLSASATDLGYQCFGDCRNLTSITVDPMNPVYSSSNGVLFDKNQTVLKQCPSGFSGSYTIPATVITIDPDAFYYCTKVTGITISGSVTTIGNSAFTNTKITTINIPASVTSIGEEVFYACANLASITVDPMNPSYSSDDGVLFDKFQTNLIRCPETKTGNYVVPPTVSEITTYAFSFCDSLTGITIPNSVTKIGPFAFYSCIAVTDITIPDNLTTIDSQVFDGCESLTQVTIPPSVTQINDYAFSYCTSLTTAIFPGNAPVMEGGVFSSTATGFTVKFLPSSTGFTTPTWNGYPSAMTAFPVVTGDLPPTLLSATGAVLKDQVNPEGIGTTVSYRWGATNSYGNTTPSVNIGSGTSGVLVSATISAPDTNSTYHYQVIMTGSTGTYYGPDQLLLLPGQANGSYFILLKQLWDLTGEYSGTLYNGIALTFALREDPAGKLTGTGTFQYSGSAATLSGSITVTAMMKTSGTIPMTSLNVAFLGSGTAVSGSTTHPASASGKMTLGLEVDGPNSRLVSTGGNSRLTATDSVTRKQIALTGKIHSGDTFNLPGDVDGECGLALDLVPKGLTYSGSATLTTSAGQMISMTPSGAYSDRQSASLVNLKGKGGNSLSLVLSTSDGTVTLKSSKGKLLGQTIK